MTLDPSLAFEGGSVPIIQQLFKGLVSLTSDMDVTPELAKSWELLEFGRKYIFYLREDAFWTDGTPVTAHDFVYAWRRVLDPATHPRNPVLFYDIHGARDYHEGRITNPHKIGFRALDDYTLEVELDEPAGYFLHLLTYVPTYPLPRHIIEEKGSAWTEVGNIVTNGPFRLEEMKREERFVMTRNPHYYGRFNGNVDRVEFSSRPEYDKFAARLAAYEADHLDVCGFGISPGASDRARQQHAGEYVSLPTANVSFLVFDTTRPPFDDARVRRAFVQAIDRDRLAEVLFRGYVSPATGGMVPPGLPGHSAAVLLPYAPEQARRLMAEAGYPGGKEFPVVDVWQPSQETTQIAEFIHDQLLENLWVETHWEMMKSDVLYYRLEHENHPHIFVNGWLADYPDPDNFLRVGVSFQSNWHHPVYDRLVEEARRVTDQTRRMKMYQEADRLLIQEAPIMPVFYGRAHLLVKPGVRKLSISPIQSFILKDAVIEPHEP